VIPPCLFLRRMGLEIAPLPAARDDIVRYVAEAHGMTRRGLTGYLPRSAVKVRDEAIWLLRQTRTTDGACPNSSPALAAYFGLQNHTTVLAAERRHARRIAERAA
jgi:chromosomal replication initiation ATPase DnaA